MSTSTAAWATRAELLTERAERLRDLERRRYGWRRDIRPGLAMLVAAFVSMSALLELENDPTDAAIAIWWTLCGATLCVLLMALVRSARTSRALDAELRTWGGIDRTRAARNLPAGDIPVELLTPFDARDHPDLADVLGRSGAAATARIYDTRALVWPAARAAVPWCFGLVLLLGGALSGDGVVASLPTAVVGGVALIAASCRMWTTWTEAFRRQQRVNSAFEGTLYSARRMALAGTPPPASLSVPLAAQIVVGLIALALLGLLFARLAASSALAVLVALAIVAAAGALIAVPLLSRRVLHVVPVTSGGETVLDPPRRRIAIDQAGQALVIRDAGDDAQPVTIPFADVLAVVDVSLGYPFAPPAVGIVTLDENIVVAGSQARSHPAIAAAREAAEHRRP